MDLSKDIKDINARLDRKKSECMHSCVQKRLAKSLQTYSAELNLISTSLPYDKPKQFKRALRKQGF